MRKKQQSGYQTDFLFRAVQLPLLTERQIQDLAPVKDTPDNIARYINYSVALSASRGFPFFSASNIDGNLFIKIPRKGSWKKDGLIQPGHQWGNELYKATGSHFDRGHMTRREDVQWGDTTEEAREAALSTFYYTNAVPQHAKLNQQIWRSLEDYVLHTETRNNGLKICVFTGPVLHNNDPFFVTPIKGSYVKIPTLFWKVIIFPKDDGELYRAAFLMSQVSLLKKSKVIREAPAREIAREQDRLFLEFENAETYQVNISTIEKLSALTMPDARDVYQDDRKLQLILKEVDIKDNLRESASIVKQLGFSIEGIRL